MIFNSRLFFVFRYFGIPYSHDMCPCKTCFPDNEPCIRACHNHYVSCPLIENEITKREIVYTEVSNLGSFDFRKYYGVKDSFRIVEQPSNLPKLTDLYTEKAIEFMKNSSMIDKPFFLYMAYHQTHHPQFAGMKF